ncbi:MAG: type II toxin-antitoxin system VapC family toxin [Deltaproteobacteria bacterium]|nr:type II toxin-antitoxin system VapC family toxin [Deltaproteobacteria bacterium]
MSVRFVIDNSVVMGWCFENEGNRYAEAVLESLEAGEALVPAIWPLEVGNVLLVAERKKRLSEASVVRFLALLNSLPITVEPETPERMLKEIVSLARAYNLSTYDASYLDLAMRLGLPIATQDASLARAAKKCRVPAFDPERPREKS